MQHIGCNNECFDSDAPQTSTRNVTLVFERDKLLYDIRNYAYIEGHIWDEAPVHAKHTLIEIGEDGNIDRVNRMIEMAHHSAIEILYPYTKEPLVKNEDIWDESELPYEYTIAMTVPSTMSRTTLMLLKSLIHEYIVAMVLFDWLSITHPDVARNWHEKATVAKGEINSIKHTRTGSLRRSSHPF